MITPSKIAQKYQKQIPSLDFFILLSHATGKSKEWLLANPTYSLPATSYFLFRYYTWLYRRGYSVATTTHHKEFYGLDFYVNKHVLVPRPDTEIMVEEVIKAIRQQTTDNSLTMVDVGTGSGCIPISILKTLHTPPLTPPLKGEGQREGLTTQVFATDISSKAIRVAKRNARTHNVSINFLHGNLLEPFLASSRGATKERRGDFLALQNNQGIASLPTVTRNDSTIIITANLPYLTQEQFDSEPSIQREPHSALVAQEEGLALYRELLSQIQSLLQANSYKLQAFFEIDPSQSEKIIPLIKTYLPNSEIEIQKDLAGHDRLVVIHQSV